MNHGNPPTRRPKAKLVSWLLNFMVFMACVALVLVIIRWRNPKPRSPVAPVEFQSVIRVQVLNGCGISGLASKMRDYLMKYRVDVRETDNARLMLPETVVMDRVNNPQKALAIAELIRVDKSRVIQQINQSLIDIDVTVIIGKDYITSLSGVLTGE